MDVEVLKVVSITVGIILVVVVLPIVVLMLEHQRKMAQILRGQTPEKTDRSDLAVLMGVAPVDGADLSELRRRIENLEAELARTRAELPIRPEG